LRFFSDLPALLCYISFSSLMASRSVLVTLPTSCRQSATAARSARNELPERPLTFQEEDTIVARHAKHSSGRMTVLIDFSPRRLAPSASAAKPPCNVQSERKVLTRDESSGHVPRIQVVVDSLNFRRHNRNICQPLPLVPLESGRHCQASQTT
jgi:hypothetical protein